MKGKEVLLGVTGGIAAYKACELVRMLKGEGAGVTVMMTGSAERFVTAVTFGALTGRRVFKGLFDDTDEGFISHVSLTAKADIFIVAPATANVIGKMAAGIADDLLTTALMAARCPVLFAPAMNCRMYDSPALKGNLETLKGFGVRFTGPEKGPMACDEEGWGRMSEPGDILKAAKALLGGKARLAGRKMLVTAGPTFEDIDPVRYIGNRSSGKMGYAVAGEAVSRGADVTLITGPTALAPPAGAKVVKVRSAAEMEKATVSFAGKADIIVMAAAVSDYAPEEKSVQKIKKGTDALTLKLVRTNDILEGLGRKKRKGQFIVGFAAETERLEENAMEKLFKKGLDMIAANPVGGETGFESDFNIIKIYGREGLITDTGRVVKERAAEALVDCIITVAQF